MSRCSIIILNTQGMADYVFTYQVDEGVSKEFEVTTYQADFTTVSCYDDGSGYSIGLRSIFEVEKEDGNVENVTVEE